MQNEIGRKTPSSVRKKLKEFNQRRRQHAHRSNMHSKKFDWCWNEKGFNRIALVNMLVGKTKGVNTSYLEIGCARNALFDSVASLHKVGVDPVSGGTHRMTSDEFFSGNEQTFDVVFIDGLHEYQQVKRDALNALRVVEVGGWIAFHDFLPASWLQEHVPRINEAWTGDCWKLALELKDATGLEFRIVEIDFGVGLLRKTAEDVVVPDLSAELEIARFDTFVEHVPTLPICGIDDAVRFIELGKL
jgi:hypothetical protein